ncbi:MAG: competence/damage-inducible protein A [Elusimicrobiota bacterium]|jgi:nicotinamide-nucleotide amidase|nr:competence/damage-inducible protein A [Elusimicrobiota bacterium]
MKIELISTGTELLTGKANTNAAFVGQRLLDLGFELCAVIDISDRKNDLIAQLQRSLQRSDIIIITGGLGPTFDDITVETTAQCLGAQIYSDETVLKDIVDFFKKRNISYISNNNNRQANIIKGAKILRNKYGTAPGQMIECQYESIPKTIFLFPGPPREIKPLWEEYAQPYFQSLVKGFRINKKIHICGLGESTVEELISPVINETLSLPQLKDCVEFGILAHNAVITVKFSVWGAKEDFVANTANSIADKIKEILKDDIFAYDEDSIETMIGKLLRKNHQTIATAESCTGGMIAQRITDIAGSSDYFKGTIVSYSNEAKISLLGVKKETIESFGAVSPQSASEMAKGALRAFNTDFAVSSTGIAGPGGGSKEKPVGLVYIAIASKDKTEVFKYNFIGGRQDIRERTVNTAFDILRRFIVGKQKKTGGK